MKKVVYIYAKMLAVAAMVFAAILCLAACAEEQSEPVIEIPMLTPGPTPTFVREPAKRERRRAHCKPGLQKSLYRHNSLPLA